MTDSAGRSNLVQLLLVEDNPDDEHLTLETLKEYRLTNRIHVAHDGAEALDFLFARGAYDGVFQTGLKVVLLDIKLPKVDGLEVLRQLRANPLTSHLPVVLLTSSAEEKDLVKAYALKANSYVVKPVDFGQFSDAVTEIGLYWAVLNRLPASKDPLSTLPVH